MSGCCQVHFPVSAAFARFCQNESGDLFLSFCLLFLSLEPICYSYNWCPEKALQSSSSSWFHSVCLGTSRAGLITPSTMHQHQRAAALPQKVQPQLQSLPFPRPLFAGVRQMATPSWRSLPTLWGLSCWVLILSPPPHLFSSNPRCGGCSQHSLIFHYLILSPSLFLNSTVKINNNKKHPNWKKMNKQ